MAATMASKSPLAIQVIFTQKRKEMKCVCLNELILGHQVLPGEDHQRQGRRRRAGKHGIKETHIFPYFLNSLMKYTVLP